MRLIRFSAGNGLVEPHNLEPFRRIVSEYSPGALVDLSRYTLSIVEKGRQPISLVPGV